MPVPLVEYRDMGRIGYQEAWDEQERLLAANVQCKLAAPRGADPHSLPTRHWLLFCEHPPVYTIGKGGNRNNLLVSAEQLSAMGATFHVINRGGDITYHGPGQITGYPIFDLEQFKPDLHWYLRNLEESVIRLLAQYGLEGTRSPGETGVWIEAGSPGARKICAIGVRCSRWVTMHGFAFNVNTGLQWFGHIVPCGITDKGVTSLQAELGYELDMQVVKQQLRSCMASVFGYEEQVFSS